MPVFYCDMIGTTYQQHPMYIYSLNFNSSALGLSVFTVLNPYTFVSVLQLSSHLCADKHA